MRLIRANLRDDDHAAGYTLEQLCVARLTQLKAWLRLGVLKVSWRDIRLVELVTGNAGLLSAGCQRHCRIVEAFGSRNLVAAEHCPRA